jgi:hypothetical protein
MKGLSIIELVRRFRFCFLKATETEVDVSVKQRSYEVLYLELDSHLASRGYVTCVSCEHQQLSKQAY